MIFYFRKLRWIFKENVINIKQLSKINIYYNNIK